MPRRRVLFIIPAILILTVSTTNGENNAKASTDDSDVSLEELIRNCKNGNDFACAKLEGRCPQAPPGTCLPIPNPDR